MSLLEITWASDDPDLQRVLADAEKRPKWDPERLIVEAALCEWHARRCWQQIGERDGYNRAESAVSARNSRNSRSRAALGRPTTPRGDLMGYIHRAHHCPKPTDGRIGDIWECDECRRRWQMTILGWLPYVPKAAPHPVTADDTREDGRG